MQIAVLIIMILTDIALGVLFGIIIGDKIK